MDRATELPAKRLQVRGKVEQGVKGDDDRRRWLALLLVCGAQLMIVLDGTIVNVALPAIQGSPIQRTVSLRPPLRFRMVLRGTGADKLEVVSTK